MRIGWILLITLLLALPASAAAAEPYPWPTGEGDGTLAGRIPPPAGFTRVPVETGSFGAWLRGLPIKPGRPEVLLHNGKKKGNQRAHHVVVDIDTGSRDLQQCADAVMRLRAEYLHATEHDDAICFRMTSGDANPWTAWRDGRRPRVKGNQVRWKNGAKRDPSYTNFRRYLNSVFTWSGTYSLQRELKVVDDPTQVRIGDVFIHGGFPGHAVLVADVATNDAGERVFLLIQSYMPAQDMHVLRGPDGAEDPWYPARKSGVLSTPEWTFDYGDLRRFGDRGCPAIR